MQSRTLLQLISLQLLTFHLVRDATATGGIQMFKINSDLIHYTLIEKYFEGDIAQINLSLNGSYFFNFHFELPCH